MKRIIAVCVLFCLAFSLCAFTDPDDLYELRMPDSRNSVKMTPVLMEALFNVLENDNNLRKIEKDKSSCVLFASIAYAELIGEKIEKIKISIDDVDFIFVARLMQKGDQGLIAIFGGEKDTVYLTVHDGGSKMFATKTDAKTKSEVKAELNEYADAYLYISFGDFITGIKQLADALD